MVCSRQKNKEPRATWWVYKSYADMTGRLVRVTPSATVEALGSLDESKASALLLLGRQGGKTGSVTLRVEHVSSALSAGPDDKVKVVVEHLPDRGWLALPEPLLVSETLMEPVSGNLVVQIDAFPPGDAYVVRLSAVKARPQPISLH